MRRKGELSAAELNRRYPHQVALEQLAEPGAQYHRNIEIEAFCKEHPSAPRTHSVVVEDRWWVVHCFAEAAVAAEFMRRFGGRAYDSKAKPRSPGWQGKGDFKRF